MAIIKFALSVLTALALMAQASFDYFGVQREMFAGLAGNLDALNRAMAACERTLAENPKHAQALVWHGIGTMAQAWRDPQQAPALTQKASRKWTKRPRWIPATSASEFHAAPC